MTLTGQHWIFMPLLNARAQHTISNRIVSLHTGISDTWLPLISALESSHGTVLHKWSWAFWFYADVGGVLFKLEQPQPLTSRSHTHTLAPGVLLVLNASQTFLHCQWQGCSGNWSVPDVWWWCFRVVVVVFLLFFWCSCGYLSFGDCWSHSTELYQKGLCFGSELEGLPEPDVVSWFVAGFCHQITTDMNKIPSVSLSPWGQKYSFLHATLTYLHKQSNPVSY